MSVITTVLAVLVAAEFLFIFYLETLATTSARTAQTFNMTVDELSRCCLWPRCASPARRR